MKSKEVVFSDKELTALYKLIKESHEKAPQTEEDAHFFCVSLLHSLYKLTEAETKQLVKKETPVFRMDLVGKKT